MDKFIHKIFNKQLFILIVLFFCSYTAKADYSVQLRVSQWCVSGSHDCDNWPNGDSDFQVDLEAYDHTNNLGLGGWDNCSEEINGNNSPGCRALNCNTNVTLDDRLFLDWRFRIQEDDIAGGDAIWGWNNACFVPNFAQNDNTWRTMAGFPRTASIGDGDCSNSPVPYSITVEWKLTGSSSAPVNDFACNATQIAMGGASANLDFCESTGGINGTNVGAKDEDLCGNDEPNESEGRTVWYKFTTGATISNRASILVENRNAGDNMTPWVAVQCR